MSRRRLLPQSDISKQVNDKGLDSSATEIIERVAICCHSVIASETSESYRHIVQSPDVRSGHSRVDGARIVVHDAIGLLQNSDTIESVVTAACRRSPKPKCTSASSTPRIVAERLT